MMIVCDTNVLVSGLVWEGAPGRVLDRVDLRIDQLFLSRELVDEFVDVVNRRKIREVALRRGRKPLDLIAWVVERGIIVLPKPLGRRVIDRDPADDQVLVCAATVAAHYVVSGDGHLLELASFQGIPIVTPAAYLDRVEGGEDDTRK